MALPQSLEAKKVISLSLTRCFFAKNPAAPTNAPPGLKPSFFIKSLPRVCGGPVSVPSGEAQARKLLNELEYRLTEGRRKLIRLAEERAGTEKLREQVVETLYRWFIHGEPEPARSART